MDFKLVIGFCSLGHPEDAFIDTFVDLLQSGIAAAYCKMSGALLPFVRNKLVSAIYDKDPDFTHILFIDDDMHNFNRESVQILIDADKDVVSGLMLKRKPPYQIVHSFPGSTNELIKKHWDEKALVEVHQTGMAFTLIKREVFDTLQEHTPEGPIWFTTDRIERDGFKHEVEAFIKESLDALEQSEHNDQFKEILLNAITFGQTSHHGSILNGEDISFCRLAKKLGFSVWVHYGVPVGHIGLMSYDMRNI